MEYYSANKRNKITAFLATWKDLEIIMISEISSESEIPTSYAIAYMWHLKKGHNGLLCITDIDSQTLKNLWFPNQSCCGGGRVGLGVWDGNSIKLGCDDCCMYNYKCNKIH